MFQYVRGKTWLTLTHQIILRLFNNEWIEIKEGILRL